MRRIAWIVLVVFVFAIPWEYSLDLGEPLGNVARLAGLLLLMAAVPAVLQAKGLRAPGLLQWLVLALYLWFCLTAFWSIDQAETLLKLRAFFQEMMVVWLVWEFAESPEDLRTLLRATVLGCWVLAALTLADFRSAAALVAEQVRFAAYGQDPNDVARLLALGLPLAGLLAATEKRRSASLLAFAYLPVGFLAVLLTASRGGFLAALVALAGVAVVLLRGHRRAQRISLFALPVFLAAVWLAVPSDIFARLATISEQLRGGDLNQRLNIWSLGWRAFVYAPVFGSGMGTFVAATGLSSIDTAHNTILAILVGGGLCGLFLCVAIVLVTVRAAFETGGRVRIAFGAALLSWLVSAQVATVEESRFTWLLIALVALAARLAAENCAGFANCFPEPTGVALPTSLPTAIETAG